MKTKRDLIQEEGSQAILIEKDLILFISIRLGKTRIALKAIEKGDTVLVVYPNSDIRKSWTDELEKFKPLSDNIVFTTKNSLKHHKDKYYDFVILDEPQLMQSKKQVDLIRTIKFRKRVALTGTLNTRTQAKLDDQLGLKVKFSYTIADAIKDKLVKDYRIHIHFTELDNITRNIPYKKFGKSVVGTERDAYNAYSQTMNYFDTSDNAKAPLGFKKYMGLRTNFLYNCQSLLDCSLELISKYKHEKALIYTLRQDIADQLANISYHSNNKHTEDLEAFKVSDKGHMAVVNCVQAGITITKLNRVIFHSYESNSEILYQKLGRSLLYEFDGEISNVHICVLKDTQMEKWVSNACKSLEQDKISYIFKNKAYDLVSWIKFNYPNKELYRYNGSICYMVKDGSKYGEFVFVENPATIYTLSMEKVIKI